MMRCKEINVILLLEYGGIYINMTKPKIVVSEKKTYIQFLYMCLR